jgi:hypothetical protein
MAKYRPLTSDELEALEPEFVRYLVANGIPAEDWQKLLTEDIDAADRIVDLFSDVVMEGVLRKTTYVEFYSKRQVLAFCFGEEKVSMLSMSSNHIDADFTDAAYITYATANPPEDLQLGRQTKAYVKSRSEEVWDLLSQGCTVSDGKLYRALEGVID